MRLSHLILLFLTGCVTYSPAYTPPANPGPSSQWRDICMWETRPAQKKEACEAYELSQKRHLQQPRQPSLAEQELDMRRLELHYRMQRDSQQDMLRTLEHVNDWTDSPAPAPDRQQSTCRTSYHRPTAQWITQCD